MTDITLSPSTSRAACAAAALVAALWPARALAADAAPVAAAPTTSAPPAPPAATAAAPAATVAPAPPPPPPPLPRATAPGPLLPSLDDVLARVLTPSALRERHISFVPMWRGTTGLGLIVRGQI